MAAPRATRILLADLAHTAAVTDRSLTVPLGIGYVKAYCDRNLGAKVSISLFKRPERLLAAAHAQAPDIVGFANYGWNENLNREIGRYLRQKHPAALFVAGGPNIDPAPVSRLAFLKKHDYIDFLVIDGGEEPFAELVEWVRLGTQDRSTLPPNLVWRDGDAVLATGERKLSKLIDNIPSPYLNGDLDEFLEAGMVPLFETNRGCPFRCTFCAWGSASKDLVRRLDVGQALAEIAYVAERSDARNWIICDANFGILERDIDIARAIRRVKNERGHPRHCHIWLAKNVTDRNLAIGEILGDMIVPVMAVQSLDDEVLRYIKRDNISMETYARYHERFHRAGSRTYSDLIVPLPRETLATHLDALRTMMKLGVDVIQCHNMRLLAGAETNSRETRDEFRFRTRYRLIHGDAGAYRAPDGADIRAFEYEESLRSTDNMTEEEVFYLRKLHFLVDFCWNIEVYAPLLRLGLRHGVNPLDVLVQLLREAETGADAEMASFFARFERSSREEWFDSAEEIETYFSDPANFARLVNQEFEKLNLQFSVILLQGYKVAFDRAIARVLAGFSGMQGDDVEAAQRLTFAMFPPLGDGPAAEGVRIPGNLLEDGESGSKATDPSAEQTLYLLESKSRRDLRQTISTTRGMSLSKILDTQGVSLRDLRLAPADGLRLDRLFSPARVKMTA